MPTIKCIHCGGKISEEGDLDFKADTTVEGRGTLHQFENGGIDYNHGDTYNDSVICPHCGKWTPIGEEPLPPSAEELTEALEDMGDTFKRQVLEIIDQKRAGALFWRI